MKILLNGYFYKNLGDDLFFHLITDRYPQHTFYVPVHADHAGAYTGRKNVKILPQTKWKRGMDKVFRKFCPRLVSTARLARRTDLGVLIGGSLFQETVPGAMERLARMPRHPKGQYIMGINFGPHKTQAYVDACARYLESAQDVCFRDAASYEQFADLPNTRLGSDLVFGIRSLCPPASQTENTCVISVMDFASHASLAPYAEDYFCFLRRVIDQQTQQGRKVILLSFCAHEGDERAIERLLSQCPQEVHRLCYDGRNYAQICSCISSASCLIASRFHSVVLGLAYGVPTVPISYSNKTLQLLQDLGQEAICPDMLAATTQLHPIPALDMTPWVAKAQLHFAALDERS